MNDRMEQRHRLLGQLGGWMFEAMPFAMFVVDRERRVVFHNRRAGELIAARDGLAVDEGRLSTVRVSDAARLDGLVRPDGRSPGRPAVVRIERPSGRTAYGLLALSFADGGADPDTTVLIVSDSDGAGGIAGHVVCDMLDLTRMEGEVAALIACGKPIPDVARQLGITDGTVRVHLRNIFRKTGIGRQADLAVTILRSVATLCAPAGGAVIAA